MIWVASDNREGGVGGSCLCVMIVRVDESFELENKH